MTELRSLFYADAHAFINDFRRALRSPGRLLLWAAYVCFVTFFFLSRTFHAAPVTRAGVATDLARADYIMCAEVVGLALSLAFGAGRIGFFRTLAEARFIIGSRVAAPLAIAYLQARASLSSAFRWISSLFYVGFIFAPRHLGVAAAAADISIVATLFGATNAIALTRKLAPRPWPVACMAVGIPLALAAAEPALRDAVAQPFLATRLAGLLRALPDVHPGLILLVPNPLWLLLPIVIVAGAIAVLASAGRDAYPELYALSVQKIDNAAHLAERRARKGTEAPSKPVRVRLPAPAGPIVLVWKSVVEFRRAANPVVFVAGVAFWLAAGFAAARGLERFGGGGVAAILSLGQLAIFLLSLLATNKFAFEMKRSLFWLSPASLFERLAVLLVAYNWRKILTLELVALGLAAGGGSVLEIAGAALVMPALVLLVGSVGSLVYAFVPNAVATGGPVVILRLILSTVVLAPVLAAGVLGALVGAPIAAALIALAAVLEAAGLTAISAWRIDGRIDRVTAPT